jgi:L-threonylcarbamoyladenylate synthase
MLAKFERKIYGMNMTSLPNNIAKAADLLRIGGLVAFPTETVYGLGADAANELAVRKVFQVKGRPYDHPLIVHLSDASQMDEWAEDISELAKKLAKAFWPGPLTIVLKKRSQVLNCVTGNQSTVALRVPSHPVARALLKAFGGGVVAPSANKFTRISPTTASAVHEEFGNDLEMVLDGGACEVGLESTIIDLSGDQPILLRPGKISLQALSDVLGCEVIASTNEKIATRAPGMHHLHYAPETKTILIEPKNIAAFLATLRASDLPVGLVMYSQLGLLQTNHPNVFYVKMSDEPHAYAHELYRTLRAMDNQHYKRIVIEAVPNGVEWDAIRDRLQKASGNA